MKIDFDPNTIEDLEKRENCQEAIEILADAEPAIMKEALLRSTKIEGQIEYLQELRRSRKSDFRSFPERQQNIGTKAIVWFSDYMGIKEGSYDEEVAKWICILSVRWLENKIDEMMEPREPEPSNEDSNSAPSTPFQVLAIHYLLKHGNYEMNGVQKAKLIEAITGKHYKNIYDAVRNPLTTAKGKARTTDLLKARELFESVGLGEIAKIISSDLQ